jgi:retron-type reverse transcriptase
MKRMSNLYQNTYDFNNIIDAFNEVCRNTKNKKKVEFFKEYKCTYISRIYNTLKNEQYVVGPYNIFTIYEPKERRIVSQNMQDKVINHLVARQILYPSILPSLLNFNVASRKNLGTSFALNLYNKYKNYYQSKYKTFYVLKCDINKFFQSIDHDILKQKLLRKIKDKKALKIVFDIIDSDEKGLSIR